MPRRSPTRGLKASLRPYQQVGFGWLRLLSSLGLGACLADDMGLGKTIQVLALLLELKRASGDAARTCWSCPASLVGNWQAEIARFAPALARARRPLLGDARRRAGRRSPPSASPTSTWSSPPTARLRGSPWLRGARAGTLVVLDEAQAIKNPGAKQTRAVKALRVARAPRAHRHAGREPPRRSVVAVRLPQSRACSARAKAFGTLRQEPGSAAGDYGAAAQPGAALHPAAAQDRPPRHRRPARQDRGARLLRRSTKIQAALYQDAVDELQAQLATVRRDGIERRGRRARVPDALQADLQPPVALARRRRARRPRTAASSRGCARSARRSPPGRRRRSSSRQFREMTEPLAGFLASVFGRAGPGAARRHAGQGAPEAGRSRFSATTRSAVLRALAQGGRHRAQPDGRLARHPLRSLVEPGGREPGHRPRLPHRPEEERAGAQVRLPRHDRGADRRADRSQEGAVAASSSRAAARSC